MNEFMDFSIVLARPSLYKYCHGYSACSLPKCRPPAHGLRRGLSRLACRLFCEPTAP